VPLFVPPCVAQEVVNRCGGGEQTDGIHLRVMADVPVAFGHARRRMMTRLRMSVALVALVLLKSGVALTQTLTPAEVVALRVQSQPRRQAWPRQPGKLSGSLGERALLLELIEPRLYLLRRQLLERYTS
jgi:hypothetical protein